MLHQDNTALSAAGPALRTCLTYLKHLWIPIGGLPVSYTAPATSGLKPVETDLSAKFDLNAAESEFAVSTDIAVLKALV
jgi:hypothetical protein